MGSLLFVYGTLKRGGENHRRLAVLKARFVGEGKIKARLYRIQGQSYPGAVPTASRAYIHGDLYELSDLERDLRKLDQFEGERFARKMVDVWVGPEKFKAWVYFYAGPKDRISIIPSGRFRVRFAAARGEV